MTPTNIAATFVGGSLDCKWTYLPQGEVSPYDGGSARLTAPTGETYELAETVWHSHEDDVMSHQVWKLVAPSGAKKGTR